MGEVPQERGPSPTSSRGVALVLRPWRQEDAPALVAAWADPEIQRWTGVPARRDLAAAERWIAGDEARRRAWLSLDLVVERGRAVAGEVGLSSVDRETATAEIGWWTAPMHRRHGVATASARVLAEWARRELGLTVVARCDPANPVSLVVARRAGIQIV